MHKMSLRWWKVFVFEDKYALLELVKLGISSIHEPEGLKNAEKMLLISQVYTNPRTRAAPTFILKYFCFNQEVYCYC